MSVHVFPILNAPPTSLPIPSLWVIPVYQLRASCILHRTWTGDSFLIWYYAFQCHSPKSSHPLPLPQSPKECSIHLCLFCCLAYRVYFYLFSTFSEISRYYFLKSRYKIKLRPHDRTGSFFNLKTWVLQGFGWTCQSISSGVLGL